MSSERQLRSIEVRKFKELNFLREQIRVKKIMLRGLINGSLEFNIRNKKSEVRAYCVIRLDKIVYFLKLLAEERYEEFGEQWNWEFSSEVQSVESDDPLYNEARESISFLKRGEIGKKDLSELIMINDALALMLVPIFNYSPKLIPEELELVECLET